MGYVSFYENSMLYNFSACTARLLEKLGPFLFKEKGAYKERHPRRYCIDFPSDTRIPTSSAHLFQITPFSSY
jgi:hypothetical protein